MNLPIDKLEPRPPVAPRTFEKLVKFLDNAMPASGAPAKRRGRPPGSGSAAKKARNDDSQIDPKLRQQGSSQRRSRNATGDPAALEETNDAPVLSGVPRWLPKFLSRIRPKWQQQMPEHARNRILHDEKFLLSLTAAGVRAVRGDPPPDGEDAAAPQPQDNSPAMVVAILIVLLKWHLGPGVLDVSKFARFCTQELAAGGVVKVTAFGGVIGDAQDLADEKGAEWEQTAWCMGEVAEPQPKRRTSITRLGDGTAGETQEAGYDDQANDADAAEDQEAEADLGPTEVPRSRCGPMAQAQPDLLSSARKRDYKQWKSKTMKRITTIEKQQGSGDATAQEQT